MRRGQERGNTVANRTTLDVLLCHPENEVEAMGEYGELAKKLMARTDPMASEKEEAEEAEMGLAKWHCWPKCQWWRMKWRRRRPCRDCPETIGATIN
jgi:hypothetical protein